MISYLKTADTRPDGTVTIGHYGGWWVQIHSTDFHDQLVLVPEGTHGQCDFGWCYPKDGSAHLAALTWNPELQAEPLRYHKPINRRRRYAGQTRNETP